MVAGTALPRGEEMQGRHPEMTSSTDDPGRKVSRREEPMKRPTRILSALGSALLLSLPAAAEHSMTRGTVCSGGGVRTTGNYTMRATVGQPAVGRVENGTHIFRMGSGFLYDWWLNCDVIEPLNLLPRGYALSQNYPNPFNPITRLRFEVPAPSHVSIRLYDVSGRVVRIVVDELLEPGFYEGLIDASGLASGLYFCRMTAASFQASRVLALTK
jgi:hypothetical protein